MCDPGHNFRRELQQYLHQGLPLLRLFVREVAKYAFELIDDCVD